MGMAASQARYLALVARKSNCEYEGQQINQARTVLSNQSANLFNQMLGLSVPVPPSTQDFTKQQYSYTDGINESVIESWQQLATPEEDYNYVVTHYYYTDVYTGSQKKMNDPQVQFDSGSDATAIEIKNAAELLVQTKQAYDEALAATNEKKKEAATLSNYTDNVTYTGVNESSYDEATDTFSFKTNTMEDTDPAVTYVGYSSLTDDNAKDLVLQGITLLIEEGALNKNPEDIDMSDVYYNATDGTIAFKSDLERLYGGGKSNSTICPVYHLTGNNSIGNIVNEYDTEITALENADFLALQAYQAAEAAYDSLGKPTYIGNSALTLVTNLSESQSAELNQIMKDMLDQNVNSSINDCFDNEGNYIGGIYEFKHNGVTYYTTFDDLNASYQSGNGINNIDGQAKLAYYNATYVSTKIEETEKALLQTDENGRFVSVRFEDDTVTYSLNMETVTDDIAYQDAMNQYYYDSAVYDKLVQDINAKTSIIQQEDQMLELRLKQLDTEQSALSWLVVTNPLIRERKGNYVIQKRWTFSNSKQIWLCIFRCQSYVI